jgi:disulfide bond formation protein DsbB
MTALQDPQRGTSAFASTRPSFTHELAALGLALGCAVAALGLMVGALFLMRSLQLGFTPNPNAVLPELPLGATAGPILDAETFVHGRDLFTATCAACHGPKGLGVRGLGKDLTRSTYVFERGDQSLIAFIRRGRDVNDPLNTTKVPMPPSGGNPSFTDKDLAQIVAYVRGLQDPRRAPTVPDAVPVRPGPATDAEKAAALAAAGGDAELAEFIANGTKIFGASCAACHGKDAHGMTGLGKDLIASEFARKLDDDGLLAFLKKGRDPSDPLNTTKVGMPARGGNPALTDDDLLDVIAYVRSLQKGAPAKAQ